MLKNPWAQSNAPQGSGAKLDFAFVIVTPSLKELPVRLHCLLCAKGIQYHIMTAFEPTLVASFKGIV